MKTWSRMMLVAFAALAAQPAAAIPIVQETAPSYLGLVLKEQGLAAKPLGDWTDEEVAAFFHQYANGAISHLRWDDYPRMKTGVSAAASRLREFIGAEYKLLGANPGLSAIDASRGRLELFIAKLAIEEFSRRLHPFHSAFVETASAELRDGLGDDARRSLWNDANRAERSEHWERRLTDTIARVKWSEGGAAAGAARIAAAYLRALKHARAAALAPLIERGDPEFAALAVNYVRDENLYIVNGYRKTELCLERADRFVGALEKRLEGPKRRLLGMFEPNSISQAIVEHLLETRDPLGDELAWHVASWEDWDREGLAGEVAAKLRERAAALDLADDERFRNRLLTTVLPADKRAELERTRQRHDAKGLAELDRRLRASVGEALTDYAKTGASALRMGAFSQLAAAEEEKVKPLDEKGDAAFDGTKNSYAVLWGGPKDQPLTRYGVKSGDPKEKSSTNPNENAPSKDTDEQKSLESSATKKTLRIHEPKSPASADSALKADGPGKIVTIGWGAIIGGVAGLAASPFLGPFAPIIGMGIGALIGSLF